VLTTAGGVKCWGDNFFVQLGDGTTTDRLTPVDVVGLSSGVVALAAGDTHTCAVTAAGGVKCWGNNNLGQLGDGTTVARSIPTDVVGLTSGVASVAAGGTHSCALTTAGALKCWGSNFLGQLGDGSTDDHHTPALIIASGVSEVTTGEFYTCVLSTGGSAKCWGSNEFGQLGDGSTIDRTAPVNVLGLGGGVVMIDAGGFHTCALLTDSTIQCWGNAAYGQLGDGRFLALSTSPQTVVIALAKPTPTATPCPGSGCATPTPTPTRTPTPQPGSGIDFSIGIDVDGNSVDDCDTSGGPGTCSISPGAVFRLRVYLNDLPTQTRIYDGVLAYLSYNGLLAKSGTANNDAWPDCSFPVSYYGNQFVVMGCAGALSSYRGEIGDVDFTCTQSGDITLVNRPTYTELTKYPLNYSEAGDEQLHVNCVVVPSPTPQSVGGIAHDVQLGGASRGTLVAAMSSLALLLALIAGAGWIARRGSF
jgi:hypothetical protein